MGRLLSPQSESTISDDDVPYVTLNEEMPMMKGYGSDWLATDFGGASTNMARRMVMAIATLLLLTACAGQQARLTTENRRSLSTEPQLHAVHHKSMGSFSYESTGYSLAGALITPLVAFAQVAEGAGMQSDLQLEDPVLRVKDRLISALQTQFNLANVVAVSDPPKSDGIETLTQAFRTGVVLDVRTMKWGVDNARAKYSARARLIRLSNSATLWQATCEYVADKAQPSPKMDELKANNGILLKAKILDAADGCADQLITWLNGQAS